MLSEKQQRLESFSQTRYRPIKRDGNSYADTYQWARQGIARVLPLIKEHPRQDQTARLMRDEIDFYLKRCHEYCIKQRIGAHYREVGVSKQDCDFEHVIPKALTRELLIYGELTIQEALNIPTCLLSSKKHRLINETHVSTTPNPWLFWQRYQSNLSKLKIETYDGHIVDMGVWSLGTHFEYFANFYNER